jgi:predicted lipoprotein with Yx(FWY)xxD motif
MNPPQRKAVFYTGLSCEERWCVRVRDLIRGVVTRSAVRWAGGALAVALAGGALATGPAMASTHQAHSAHTTKKTATVVKVRTRHGFGKILVTTKGRALYTLPHGSCTGPCLGIWPRLVMPKGKTIPKGAMCLGTAKFGKNHRLQVTYHKKRLYTFVSDSGTSVTGNGVEGFKVAKVVKCSH